MWLAGASETLTIPEGFGLCASDMAAELHRSVCIYRKHMQRPGGTSECGKELLTVKYEWRAEYRSLEQI